MMNIYETIIEAYPELSDLMLFDKYIMLQNDSDGVGDYVAKWGYSKPIPKGLKLGKPLA
jgi:hypothetical protein